MGEILNAFTVDVEDYFQVSGFEKDIDRGRWDWFESRVVANTHRILDLLDRHDVRGTFFVLGWIARRYPHLVRDIHDRGHEIASHGYWHRLVYDVKPEEFRHEIRRSRDLLADITGERVTAYRAPSFSITKRSLWALEILVEEGYTVDSSIFPVHHDRYGIPDADPTIHQITTNAGTIWEFPPAVVKFARMNLPVSGGGYFRLYPLYWTTRCLRKINSRLQRPFLFYVHPWEVDPEQPRLKAGTRISRFRHYVNLRKTQQRLESLLQSFRFARICDVIGQRAKASAQAVSLTDSSIDIPVAQAPLSTREVEVNH